MKTCQREGCTKPIPYLLRTSKKQYCGKVCAQIAHVDKFRLRRVEKRKMESVRF